MTDEEYQDEIRRRDEIIDRLQGLELDVLYLGAKLEVIKCIMNGNATERERLKMVKALIFYG